MEEKKETKSVDMKPTERKEKLSYEELENVAKQISEQNKQMYQQIQQMNMANMFQRLNYLFKVLEQSIHFDEEFITSCVKEIQDIMTIPEDNNTEEGK